MPQLAMPLFADAKPVSRDAVLAAWKKLFPRGPRLTAAAGGDDKSVDDYTIDGKRTVFVAHMPAPVPNDEALHAVRSSWMWQGPDDPVRKHRSHALVTTLDDERPIGAAWDVARMCAAVLSAGKGAGLYWGNSRQTHPAQVAIELGSSDHPPVPLCVGITISGQSAKGPFSAATHGLEALGLKDFEVRDTRMGIGDLRMTLLNLAAYVIDKGPVLQHGQTFGPTASDRWTISHEPSKLVDGRDAIVLGIP